MADFGEQHLNELASFRALGETPREVAKRIRDLETQVQTQATALATATEAAAKAPKDGELVLTKDQVPVWTKYQALGTPDELEKGQTELGELRVKDERRTHQEGIAAAVEAEGLPPAVAGVIGLLKDVEKLTFGADKKKVKDPKTGQDGEEKFGTVTPAGEGAKPVRLTDYVTEHWPTIVPLLTATGDAPARKPAGVPAVTSVSGAGNPPAPSTGDELEEKRASGVYNL